MPLRNQPYLPLYVQDVLTDEKLIECTASSQGVYFRLLCVLHKQDEYGKYLLKQKYKQTDEQIINFAYALVRPLALPHDIIVASLGELIDENVLFIEDDYLCQKRMIKDAEISDKRALAGRKGGKKTVKNNKNFAKANIEANTEYENEIKDINKGNGILNKKNVQLIQKEIDWLKEKHSYDASEEIGYLTSINNKLKKKREETGRTTEDEDIFQAFCFFIDHIPDWFNYFSMKSFDNNFESLQKAIKDKIEEENKEFHPTIERI